MRAVMFTSDKGDLNFNLALKNNYAATAAPAVTDDAGDGYEVGSIWIYGNAIYQCTDKTVGASVWIVVSDGSTTAGQLIGPPASSATAAGGNALVRGGTGGTTSGAGGSASAIGGAATAGNSNGGSVIRRPGAKSGTGVAGFILQAQPTPTAKTVSATLTAAELQTGILTVNQAAGGASTLTMPLGTDLEAAMPPEVAANDSFDFAIVNISTVDAEDATLAANTGVTLVGNVTIEANSATTKISSGLFRCRRTAANTFVVYRIS